MCFPFSHLNVMGSGVEEISEAPAMTAGCRCHFSVSCLAECGHWCTQERHLGSSACEGCSSVSVGAKSTKGRGMCAGHGLCMGHRSMAPFC